MIVKPWATPIAAMPGRPTPSPTTAAAPAPMNTSEKVPTNSARSLDAIRLDNVLSRVMIHSPSPSAARTWQPIHEKGPSLVDQLRLFEPKRLRHSGSIGWVGARAVVYVPLLDVRLG